MTASGWQVFVEIPGKPPVELAEGESVIGRSRSCAVQISDSTVSRQHAILQVTNGSVRLKDLGSSNGTFVNGKRASGEQPLADGDRLVIGEAEIVLHVLAPLAANDATVRVAVLPFDEKPSAGGVKPAPVAAVGQPATPSPPPPPPQRTPAPQRTPIPPSPIPPAPFVPTPPAPQISKPPLADAGGGELLPSIQEIERTPMPPPPPRKATVASPIEPAGFWIRVGAALLEMIPMALLAALGFGLAFVNQSLVFVVSAIQLLYGLAIAFYFPAQFGWTPAKKLLGLRIYADPARFGEGIGWGKALMRFLGHLVCGVTCGLGYLLVAFTSRKQGLHDLIAGTFVGRRR